MGKYQRPQSFPFVIGPGEQYAHGQNGPGNDRTLIQMIKKPYEDTHPDDKKDVVVFSERFDDICRNEKFLKE